MMNKYATLSECPVVAVLPMRSHLECQPVVHDPARDVYVPDMPDEAEEGTPLMDFVMSWATGFRLVTALAAVALVIVTVGGM